MREQKDDPAKAGKNNFYSSNEKQAESSRFDSHRNRQTRFARYPVKFHGNTAEYFRIWIVNIFLTIITLYIYSAWAKVRTKRYFHGNTTVDGSSFEYHATGKQLVAGRLIAGVLLATYVVTQETLPSVSATAFVLLMLLFPWALWRSMKFNAKMSSFRNIRFSFLGGVKAPYWILLGVPVLLTLALAVIGYGLAEYTDSMPGELPGEAFQKQMHELWQQHRFWLVPLVLAVFFATLLLLPWLHARLISYSHNHHRYGTANFSATISTGKISLIYLISFSITIVSLMVIFLPLYLVTKYTSLSSELIERLGNSDMVIFILGALAYLLFFIAMGISSAYFKSSIRNHRYNATAIEPGVRLHSEVRMWSLWWLHFSNLIMVVFSLGLAYPYTKIRAARYYAKRTYLTVDGNLDSFTDRERSRLNAMGEELADAFDVEFDIGV